MQRSVPQRQEAASMKALFTGIVVVIATVAVSSSTVLSLTDADIEEIVEKAAQEIEQELLLMPKPSANSAEGRGGGRRRKATKECVY